MKYKYPLIITGLLLFILAAVFHWHLSRQGSYLVVTTDEGRERISVEVAISPEARRQGLMFREVLPEGQGMLFLYGPNQQPTIWMKNMLIPLDIVFVTETQQISYIEKNVPPCQSIDSASCPVYQPLGVARYVLELPAGYTQKKNIKVGDRIELYLEL